MTENERFARYPSLRDAVVLITGGASGIGAAMVEQFACQGARVAFLDVADECAASLIEKLTAAASVPPTYVRCDLTKIEELRSSIRKIEDQLGTIRVLVNN